MVSTIPNLDIHKSYGSVSIMELLGWNTGNDLFAHSLYHGIVKHNLVDLCTQDRYVKMDVNTINNDYDTIVMLPGNSTAHFWKMVSFYHEKILRIKIPVHMIGVGVQCGDYCLKNFINSVKDIRSLKKVLKKIDQNGSFSVRGAFSELVLKQYFHLENVYLTGCPSLFLRGNYLPIMSNEKVPRDQFRYSINGSYYFQKDIFSENSFFICQDDLYHIQSQKGNLDKKFYHYFFSVKNNFIKLYARDRLKIFYNVKDWAAFFLENNIHFSFGSRIHGNLLPILLGIPAVVSYIDSRTREMAEFFHIPCIDQQTFSQKKYIDVYSLYQESNFLDFHKNYEDKLTYFQEYLKTISINNRFGEDLLCLT